MTHNEWLISIFKVAAKKKEGRNYMILLGSSVNTNKNLSRNRFTNRTMASFSVFHTVLNEILVDL